MIIAREKRKNNLAEYILYMWQLEDLFRGLQLDMELVEQYLVSQYSTDEESRREISAWYENLVEMMKQERIAEAGHLQVVVNMVNELTELHFYLLNEAADPAYRQLFMQAGNGLVEYRRRSNLPDAVSDVELALHALYGHLMLKLQKKAVHSQTVQAMDSFSRLLALLALRYREMEEKALEDEV